jgi:hypothetical protein
LVSADDWGDEAGLDDCDGGAVVVVVFFDVVVVVDERVLFDLDLESSDFWVVVVVDVELGAATAGAVLVVDDDGGAATRVPAGAPGRGSLAGDAGAGDDVGSAEGLAGAASTGGTAVSGGLSGSATWSAASGTERAAWRARRTSGRDRGDTPAVEKRDETSCTPNSPRRTPLAVPRAHVTTRTRRIGQIVRVATP